MIVKLMRLFLSLYFHIEKRLYNPEFVNYVRYKIYGAKLSNGVRIKKYVVIHEAPGFIAGEGTVIGDYVLMWAGGGIMVGKNVLIAAHTIITTHGHAVDAAVRGELYKNTLVTKPIVIHDNVWIGANCIILPGVTIGQNAIVAAGSVVSRDVAPNQLWRGIPAAFKKDLTQEIEKSGEGHCSEG